MSRSTTALLAVVVALLATGQYRARGLAASPSPAAQSAPSPSFQFQLEEATIADVHRAIREGQITCKGLVQAYVNRARAYNGVSNKLVTEDIAPQYLPGYAEYKAAVAATASLPDGDPKKTPPIEFGRMEATSSDPSVQQQYGMTVGIPNAGQLRALNTLNIRGERSVTCKAGCDQKEGRPANCPKVCVELANQPDAVERAAELDAQYGRNPDLAALPMYCIPFSFKDPYDAKDMRSTGGADARYDIDFPARDQTLVAQLRAKGAIIYAKANTTEYNGRAGNPGGKNIRQRCCPRRWAISAARGVATRRTRMTPRAPPRSARARARVSRSERTS